MGKDRRSKRDARKESRDGERFVALPHVVLESRGWRQAGHVARSLLIDIAQQYTGDNNGKLVACEKYLKPLGWRSHDVVTRALQELIACGLLFLNRKGARPNRTAWFALTWYVLDVREGLDVNHRTYRRGAYRLDQEPRENASLIPSGGVVLPLIVPSHGVGESNHSPSHGAIRAK